MHGREPERDLQQHGRHQHRPGPEEPPAPGLGRQQSEKEQRRTGDDGAEPVR